MMNRTRQRIWVFFAIVLIGSPAALGAEQRTVVHPKDTGEALVNPGMGWGFHFYSNVPTNYGSKLPPSDTLDYFPGLSHIYLRIPWAYLEPAEGQFDWSPLDIPAQRWIDKGRQIALRISCSESWMRYATPEWVHKAGAKGYNFTVGKGVDPNGPYWEPDYKDPVFIEKLDDFLAAMAQRYDGSPDVAFIDIGSFGVWGEGHTWASSKLPFDYETRRIHVDLHCKHFKKTLLAINDDFAGPGERAGSLPITDYALGKGVTLRDDSILVQCGKNAYFHAELAQAFWPKLPVILECEHYGSSKRKGCWQDGSLYLQAVEDYHASFASIHWWPREFFDENRELIERINLRLGYRLQLVEAFWASKVDIDSQFVFVAKWRNAGVAPCLPGGYPAVTLKDAKGGIVGVFVDEAFDVRSLPVAGPGKAKVVGEKMSFALSRRLRGSYRRGIREAGAYELYISVGTRAGTPRIALPLAGDDGHRRYRLGTLQVVSGEQQLARKTAAVAMMNDSRERDGPKRPAARWRVPCMLTGAKGLFLSLLFILLFQIPRKPLSPLLGLLRLTQALINLDQESVQLHCVRIILTQRTLRNLKRPGDQRFRLLVSALCTIQCAKHKHAFKCRSMLFTEHPPTDLQCFEKQRLPLIITIQIEQLFQINH